MSRQTICTVNDLVANSGVCALINDEQVAIFYLPNTEEKVFAINNWDPCGEANVLSRGIVGSIGEDIVVASPLYKQHFNLKTGACLEEEVSVKTYNISLEDNTVYLA